MLPPFEIVLIVGLRRKVLLVLLFIKPVVDVEQPFIVDKSVRKNTGGVDINKFVLLLKNEKHLNNQIQRRLLKAMNVVSV